MKVSLLLLTLVTLVLRNDAKNLCDVIGCSKGLTDENGRQEEKALQWRAPCTQICRNKVGGSSNCGSQQPSTSGCCGRYVCPKPKPPCPSPPDRMDVCKKPKYPPPCEPDRKTDCGNPPPCEPDRMTDCGNPPPCQPGDSPADFNCQRERDNQGCNNQACRQNQRRLRVCKIQCGLATLQQGIQTGSCQCRRRRSLRME
ncbi:hypothetical protein TNCT_25011 [Trichonephila clavata]|uniref:Uncharacterized protein n=1 Tax=Trichonephila clavata TaxID=2740835 RepID=A0A8X6LQ33_TRICU|nr:hypothetical protein TNCT_25011 [Trichonephila clavata]